MTGPPDVAAAILAGGRATRMGGRSKALLPFERRPILERQLEVLSPIFSEIAICADDPVPYARFGLPVLPDRAPGAGPLAGIAAALSWTARPFVFAVACDMPHLDSRVIELILESRRGADLVAPVVSGRPEPLHALYGARCLQEIDARLAVGRNKAAALFNGAAEAGLAAVAIDEEKIRTAIPGPGTEFRFLTNVNMPSDLP